LFLAQLPDLSGDNSVTRGDGFGRYRLAEMILSLMK
jgi:hypothetical protein